jgi:membrane protein
MRIRVLWDILKEAAIEWDRDNVSRLAAALAYYAIFSLAPLLVIVIAVAGFLFGEEAARGQIVGQFQGLIGREGAQIVEQLIEASAQPSKGIVATVVGIVAFLLGATGAFNQLQGGLNTVWEVASKPGRVVKGMLRARFLSFLLILGIGFLLLVSLVLSAALEAFNTLVASRLPEPPLIGWSFVNAAVAFIPITLLFAMIYKLLPDVVIPWRDVWLGAVITSLLFSLGKYLIGLYLGNSSIGSTYGAAGTLVVLLIWIYYSAQIFYFGAEITQAYADRFGSPIEPARWAYRYVRVPVKVKDTEAANVREIAQEKVSAGLETQALEEGRENGGEKVEVPPEERV